MNTRHHPRFLLWIAIVVLVPAVGIWCYRVKKTEWDAKNLYEQASRLQVGEASQEEVLALLRTAPGKKYGFEPCLAGLPGCIGTITIENTPLSRLRLAPQTAFGVRLGISGGKLTNRYLAMDVDQMFGRGTFCDTFVNERVTAPEIPVFRVEEVSFHYGINMTTEAPRDLKRLAYNFNFSCLTKIGGCKAPEEILPILGSKDIIGVNR